MAVIAFRPAVRFSYEVCPDVGRKADFWARHCLPFFRRPGVVNADTIGAELDMVGIHHSDYRMNLGDELLLLYWNIAIIALQHGKEDQSRCRCPIEISHALMLFAIKLIFPEGKV